MNWFRLILIVVAWALATATFSGLFGCNSATLGQQPIQETLDRVFTEVVKPAIEKALAETASETFAHQGNVEGINPGYRLDFEGYWCTGVKGSATVRVDGLAGTLTWNMQAHRDGKPTTQPAGETP